MTKERYVSFGERVGAVPPPLTLPLTSVTERFRNAIWNSCSQGIFAINYASAYNTRPVYPLSVVRGLASDKGWLISRFDRMDDNEAIRFLEKWVTKDCSWFEVYEFVEGVPRWGSLPTIKAAAWRERLNRLFAKESSPYRFVNGELVGITTGEELAEVTQATNALGKYGLAAGHLAKALHMFAARPNPDYENAAKEAASAVETALTLANGKQMKVGDAVKAFAKTHSVHTALMESASSLFGYASDRDGVRHGSKGTQQPVDYHEAKLVIVAASSWLNFIAAKAP